MKTQRTTESVLRSTRLALFAMMLILLGSSQLSGQMIMSSLHDDVQDTFTRKTGLNDFATSVYSMQVIKDGIVDSNPVTMQD